MENIRGAINFIDRCTKECETIEGEIKGDFEGFTLFLQEEENELSLSLQNGTQCGDVKKIIEYLRNVTDKLETYDK